MILVKVLVRSHHKSQEPIQLLFVMTAFGCIEKNIKTVMVDLCGNNFDLKSELLWLKFHENIESSYIYISKQYIISDMCLSDSILQCNLRLKRTTCS